MTAGELQALGRAAFGYHWHARFLQETGVKPSRLKMWLYRGNVSPAGAVMVREWEERRTKKPAS